MTDTRFFSVRNFERFQHYKDRSPPWIKLYNAILDDYEYTSLPDASRSHLLAIMLLASRTNNRIPYDAEWVALAIKATSKVDLALLERMGKIVVGQGQASHDSDLLAECTQSARPEREKRERREDKDSVANATGDLPAATDDRTRLFNGSLTELGRLTGKEPNKLRPLVGRWLKLCHDDAGVLVRAIAVASERRIADPVAWIEAGMKARAGPNAPDLGNTNLQIFLRSLANV